MSNMGFIQSLNTILNTYSQNELNPYEHWTAQFSMDPISMVLAMVQKTIYIARYFNYLVLYRLFVIQISSMGCVIKLEIDESLWTRGFN